MKLILTEVGNLWGEKVQKNRKEFRIGLANFALNLLRF
jgi:hypothetical protein